jgi:subtilisin family serine protease
MRTLQRGGAACGAVLLAVLLTATPARADRWRDAQWYRVPMKLTQAQDLGTGGAGVLVAVIDGGIDKKHQDLRGATVLGRNMATDQPDNNWDTTAHGTAMAALIAGRGHGSGDGVVGVAPRSKVMSISPIADASLLADGIRWAVEHDAKVINMSFSLESTGEVQQAINEAVAADIVLVGAVGNDFGGPVKQPSSLDNVIGVGSVTESNKVAEFSNRGEGLDLVTYGTGMPAALANDRYRLADGTSGSAALVSGVVALMRARYPDMSAAEVVDRLTKTAIDRGAKGRDDSYGYGQLDVVAALTAPRTAPPGGTAAPAAVSSASAAGPVDLQIAAEPVPERGIGSLVIVALGGLLLLGALGALAAVLIVRARRNG